MTNDHCTNTTVGCRFVTDLNSCIFQVGIGHGHIHEPCTRLPGRAWPMFMTGIFPGRTGLFLRRKFESGEFEGKIHLARLRLDLSFLPRRRVTVSGLLSVGVLGKCDRHSSPWQLLRLPRRGQQLLRRGGLAQTGWKGHAAAAGSGGSCRRSQEYSAPSLSGVLSCRLCLTFAENPRHGKKWPYTHRLPSDRLVLLERHRRSTYFCPLAQLVRHWRTT